MHQVYLSLGSNIQPETNIPKALELLRSYGEIRSISNVWESAAVGSSGPNFLNACALFLTPLSLPGLKEQIIHPIEASLGRKRTKDKFAPRTIDIDIIIFDDKSCNNKFWNQAFVIVPLAEIYPDFQNPLTQERITETEKRLRQEIWMEPRPEILNPLNRNSSKA